MPAARATVPSGVIAAAGMKPDDVDVIGPHGQTIVHLPPGMSAHRSRPSCSLFDLFVQSERALALQLAADFQPDTGEDTGTTAPETPRGSSVHFLGA